MSTARTLAREYVATMQTDLIGVYVLLSGAFTLLGVNMTATLRNAGLSPSEAAALAPYIAVLVLLPIAMLVLPPAATVALRRWRH